MPRTNLDKYRVPRTDPIKGLILAAAHDQGKNAEELAAMAGVGRTTYHAMMNKPSTEWQLSRLLGLCKGLRIPIEEIRPDIRY